MKEVFNAPIELGLLETRGVHGLGVGSAEVQERVDVEELVHAGRHPGLPTHDVSVVLIPGLTVVHDHLHILNETNIHGHSNRLLYSSALKLYHHGFTRL